MGWMPKRSANGNGHATTVENYPPKRCFSRVFGLSWPIFFTLTKNARITKLCGIVEHYQEMLHLQRRGRQHLSWYLPPRSGEIFAFLTLENHDVPQVFIRTRWAWTLNFTSMIAPYVLINRAKRRENPSIPWFYNIFFRQLTLVFGNLLNTWKYETTVRRQWLHQHTICHQILRFTGFQVQ